MKYIKKALSWVKSLVVKVDNKKIEVDAEIDSKKDKNK